MQVVVLEEDLRRKIPIPKKDSQIPLEDFMLLLRNSSKNNYKELSLPWIAENLSAKVVENTKQNQRGHTSSASSETKQILKI